MLVVSRKLGEGVWIGDGIKVAVVDIRGTKIRLGFEAGLETTILREEAREESKREKKERPKRMKAA